MDEFGDPVLEEKKIGVSRQAMLKQYAHVYGGNLGMFRLRYDYLPNIESAGLIFQEPDPNDRRQLLTYPTTAIRQLEKAEEINSAYESGVDSTNVENEIKAEDVPF